MSGMSHEVSAGAKKKKLEAAQKSTKKGNRKQKEKRECALQKNEKEKRACDAKKGPSTKKRKNVGVEQVDADERSGAKK